MTFNLTYAPSLSGNGTTITASFARSGSGNIGLIETLTVATTGTLSTRTSDTAGEVTVATGHAIVTGDTIAIHWDISGTKGVAYAATAETVAAPTGDTAIPFTGGTGDVLPAQDSTVAVSEVLASNISIDGDNAKIIGILLSTSDTALRTGGHIQFVDSGSSEVAEIDLVTNVPRIWDLDGGATNDFTGNVITVANITHGGTDSTQTYTLKILGVQDASP